MWEVGGGGWWNRSFRNLETATLRLVSEWRCFKVIKIDFPNPWRITDFYYEFSARGGIKFYRFLPIGNLPNIPFKAFSHCSCSYSFWSPVHQSHPLPLSHAFPVTNPLYVSDNLPSRSLSTHFLHTSIHRANSPQMVEFLSHLDLFVL